MKKIIIAIISIAFSVTSCGSSKNACDAYGSIENTDTTNII